MKIALVQLNPIVGEYGTNCEKIVAWSQKAAESGCDLVIFPELSLSGYPPQGLLEKPAFINAQDEALAQLLRKLPQIDVLLGCFERNEDRHGKPLFSSAVVVRDGEIIHRSRKKQLSSYDFFDESRYVEPGKMTSFYRHGDHAFGITISERLEQNGTRSAADRDFLAELRARAKAEGVKFSGIIHIAASPFLQHKISRRRRHFSKFCRENSLPLFFCNQVGGQDSLIFDGSSLVVREQGEVAAQALCFVEDMVIFNTETGQGDLHASGVEDSIAEVHKALVCGVRDYVMKTGFTKVIVGLSGGIDSALVAVLAAEALGAENLLGVALPSPYSSEDSVEDARQLADNLGCRFEILPIGGLFDAFNENLATLFAGFPEDVTEQNLQARIRGNLLMALSNKFGAMLLSTSNRSEFAVGYCTLYGDMCGGMAVLADLPKGLVYDISRYINRDGEIIPERTITKEPSAELKPGQKDEDELPPYDVLDQILELYLDKNYGQEEIVAQGFARKTVEDVLRRVRINEYKRRQSALGLRITSPFTGCRRFPIVHDFRG